MVKRKEPTKNCDEGPTIERLQKDVLEEQLQMVRENRLLIKERRALVAQKMEYVRLKTRKLQEQLVGSTRVITSVGTPTRMPAYAFNSPAAASHQQREDDVYQYANL